MLYLLFNTCTYTISGPIGMHKSIFRCTKPENRLLFQKYSEKSIFIMQGRLHTLTVVLWECICKTKDSETSDRLKTILSLWHVTKQWRRCLHFPTPTLTPPRHPNPPSHSHPHTPPHTHLTTPTSPHTPHHTHTHLPTFTSHTPHHTHNSSQPHPHTLPHTLQFV